MDKEESYSVPNFPSLDNYSLNQHPHHHQDPQYSLMKFRIGESSGDNNHNCMIDYMLNHNSQQQQQQQLSPGYGASASFDKLSFADVMQLADFGPKLALNQTKIHEEETGIDPVYYLKFPVLNDKVEESQSLMDPQSHGGDHQVINRGGVFLEEKEGQEARVSELRFLGEDIENKNTNTTNINEGKNKRKRPRTIKTSEEVESQRMTHIAVERNRRKQMNEHLRVLRTLMPGSYVQRGDQASIIGGAIEFVRELEQLLQCLESQKRRRILGEAQRQMGDNPSSAIITTQQPQPPMVFPGGLPSDHPNQQAKLNVNFETGLREEAAENKSCLADVEVKLLGFDAMIKILSRRRPEQLIKMIAALEDLQLSILHTNITTIDQTVLYSFNVKVTSETRFTAEDIASSIQQIFSFIHANTNM